MLLAFKIKKNVNDWRTPCTFPRTFNNNDKERKLKGGAAMMHLGYSHLVSEINFNGRYVRAGQKEYRAIYRPSMRFIQEWKQRARALAPARWEPRSWTGYMDLSAIRMGDKFGKEAASEEEGKGRERRQEKKSPNHSEYKTKISRIAYYASRMQTWGGRGVQDTGSHPVSLSFFLFLTPPFLFNTHNHICARLKIKKNVRYTRFIRQCKSSDVARAIML